MTADGSSVTAGDSKVPGSRVVESLRAAVTLALTCAGRLVAARVALAAAVGAAPVAAAWLMKVVLDRVGGSGGPLLPALLLLAIATTAVALLPEVARYVDAEMRRAIGLATRHRLYAAVGRLAGLRRFEDSRFHDRLSLAAETGPTGPSEVVSSAFGVGQGLVLLSAFLTTLAVINPWLLAIAILAAIPALRAELWLARRRARMVSDLGHTARREFFYAQLMTSVTAAKEVRLYGLAGLFGARMVAELRQLHAGQRRMDRRELLVQCGQGLLGAAVVGAGLVWAGYAARDGRITIGDVAVLVAALAGIQGGVAAIVAAAGRMHQALLLFDHYRFVVELEPDLAAANRHRQVARLRRGIEVRDVWFRYDESLPWALRGVSFSIPAGATTALVGRNGAGKSTLVKLLCRFYDPDRGSIHWDGVDIRDLPVQELRRRIGAMFQDFMQYEFSAADNIGVGDVDALGDRTRIETAARTAGSHDTIAALPYGYDTMLTRIYMDADDRDDPSTGVVLSGGQWQRMALARALLRDCDLLILDEPSAGLDAEAEAQVRARLAELRAGRTSLLISHRLSTLRDADSVVVLAGGAVAERGRHDDLMAANGLYARLFRLQADGYRMGSPASHSPARRYVRETDSAGYEP